MNNIIYSCSTNQTASYPTIVCDCRGNSKLGGSDMLIPSTVFRYVTRGTCLRADRDLLLLFPAFDSCFFNNLSIVFF